MPKVVHHLFKSDEKHLEQIEESLLLGASDLAKEGSIEHIEIEDILNKAQVSRSTFYKIFNSADGLFKALGQKLTNELMAYALSHFPEIFKFNVGLVADEMLSLPPPQAPNTNTDVSDKHRKNAVFFVFIFPMPQRS